MNRKKTLTRNNIKSEYHCWCGCEFRIVKSHAKNVLLDFDLFCSEECLINYINAVDPRPPTITRNPPHVSNDYTEYDQVTKKFYRSAYEVWTARCFKKHAIEFEYEPHSFFLNGSYYTPDFYLPESELYIECKGLWKQRSKAKLRGLTQFANIILLPSYFQSCLSEYKKWNDVVS